MAGHPKLHNDLVHPSMEQIGGRVTLFEFESLGPDRRAYLDRVLSQVSASKTKPEALLTDAAAILLCERLATPLQFELYLAGQLAAERTQELHDRLLAASVPV